MSAITHIPESERIPLFQKLMFSAGINMDYAATGLLTGVLWMPYFNIGMGISPATLGVVLMILLAWNAFLDPVIGNLSDNARTPWGRRRPFMAVGAVMTGIVYLMFWHMPPGLQDLGKALYLIVVGIVFFTSYSLWAMPYYGLQLELTPNYDERTRLTGWMAFFGKASSLAGGWVLAIVTGKAFINTATGKGDILIGMKSGCWVIAGVIIVFGLLPAIFVRERYHFTERKPRDPFWNSVKESIRCKPLWSLIGISFFLVLGSTSVGSLGQYLSIYYIFDGDLSAASIVGGWKGTVLAATGILSIPFWAWLGERFDKKVMVISMLIFSMVGHLMNFFCMRPDMPYLQIVPAVFESGAIAAVWLFIPSMKADTADYDELRTTRRREGSINSFYSWFIKAALTCAMGLGGLVLEVSGFTSKHVHQPADVLNRMLGYYLTVPIAIWGVALGFALSYPLSRIRMAGIRAELEERRGKI
ncbi:MAG: MFS transporter [Verrucomicrobiota bacterium]